MIRKQVAVIGLGRFGASVARSLTEMGHEVLGIDQDPERVEVLARELAHTALCACTDEEALRALGLRNFDACVVAIGRDVQASILVTVLLKEMGVRFVLAKAADDLHGLTLRKVGADRVVYPEREMGDRLAHSLIAGTQTDYFTLGEHHACVEMQVPRAFVGRSLAELRLRARFGVNVVAIKSGGEIKAAPTAGARIQAGDILVVVSSNQNLRRMEREIQNL
jgi:trk system potassium uptake protein TrkA